MSHDPARPRYSLRKDYLLLSLLALLVALAVAQPAKIPSYVGRVDWVTIATLLGLLMLAAGVEWSGYLHRFAARLVARLPDERRLALFLVAVSALLAMFLTNDVTLFVVVPLTVGLQRFTRLPVKRLIIFEALAVNTGSALTPIGNPQNIYLWHFSGLHLQEFVRQMLPPVVIMTAVLFAYAWVAFPPKTIRLAESGGAPALRPRLLMASLLLFPLYVVLLDLHRTAWALGIVALTFAAAFRDVLRRLDWPLLVVFALMFVDLSLLAELHWVREGVDRLALGQTVHLYAAGVLLSQLISNVPATLLLSQYSPDWRTLAWAVNVGGAGCVLGSLANLIALRLGRQPGSLWMFHAWALPFFAVTAACVGFWLAA